MIIDIIDPIYLLFTEKNVKTVENKIEDFKIDFNIRVPLWKNQSRVAKCVVEKINNKVRVLSWTSRTSKVYV